MNQSTQWVTDIQSIIKGDSKKMIIKSLILMKLYGVDSETCKVPSLSWMKWVETFTSQAMFLDH